MSAREHPAVCAPVCQGFLKKRKDTIRLRWVTYWFKLHNTTLYFYKIKHGGSSDLRGQYCLIEVVSVREVTWCKKKHYSFEMALRNGKRKVLAAETADLRQQWMFQIGQAMSHCVYNTTELNSNSDTEPDYESRMKSNPCSTLCNSRTESGDTLVSGRHPAEPESRLWSSSEFSAAVIPTATSLIYIAFDTSQAGSSRCTGDEEVLQNAEEEKLDNDYDVLPCCKPLHTEEVIYDTPPSNRRVSERDYETENIYDVPRPVFRKKSVDDSSCTNELPEIPGLLHDLVTCLGGNTAAWIKATAPGTMSTLTTL